VPNVAWIEPIGSLISTLIVVATFLYGLREFERTKKAQIAERRAKAAAECLIAISRFIFAVKSATSPAMFIGADDDGSKGDASLQSESVLEHDARERARAKSDERFRKVVSERWQGLQAIEIQFLEAQLIATAHLPANVEELFEEVWCEKSRVWANQNTYLGSPDAGTGAFYERGFGEEARDRLDKLLIEAKGLLRPMSIEGK
jgi:hypothetical protein